MVEVSREGRRGASVSPPGWRWGAASVSTARGEGAIATTDEQASKVGVEVLARGGTAADAAIAASLALAVVNPEAGGIGGSGYLLHRTSSGEAQALDFRSTAPKAADPDFIRGKLQDVGDAGIVGFLAVAVPGVVAGLSEMHARFGTLPWGELVEPAIELARGFLVEERLTRSFTPGVIGKLGRFRESAELFLPDGRPPRVGTTFRQADLARTLERLRDAGAADFYDGETAVRLVAAVREGGGVLTAEDLRGYRALWKEPIRFRYRGHTVLVPPPSSSGGITLALMAGILERFDLSRLEIDSSERLHLLVEGWKRTFADRNAYLGDPDFVEMPVETLLDPAYARWRSQSIGERATPAEVVAPGVNEYREGRHTTHLSVVDRSGNAVAMTLTLNTWYGSGTVAAGTGVLLNCDMDDFTLTPGAPNHFGLLQGEANVVAPGKRMLSAMSPTIVLRPVQSGGGAIAKPIGIDGSLEELHCVMGTPGGATILTTTFQILSLLLDYGFAPGEAIASPRFHHQHLPDHVEYEPGGMTAELAEAMRLRGHKLHHEREEYSGDVQMVVVEGDGSRTAWSDPRRGGKARAY